MKKSLKTFPLVFLLMVALSALSCMQGVRLNYQGAQETEVTGKYTVLLYGCNFLNDLETIAFLSKEGDKYTFEPYAPDFQFRVKKGVDGPEALAMAKKFVYCNTSFRRAELSRVLSPSGETIGYEIRPFYQSFRYGVDDVLYVDYWLKDDKVIVYVRLLPSIEKMFQDGGGRSHER